MNTDLHGGNLRCLNGRGNVKAEDYENLREVHSQGRGDRGAGESVKSKQSLVIHPLPKSKHPLYCLPRV